MKKDNSKNIIIGLLVVIIIILGTLVALFATGTISFNNNLENNNEEINKKDDLDESINDNEENYEQKLEANKNIYAEVINEYKNTLLEGYKEDGNYNYVNINALRKNLSFEYSFYDINKDGKDEMLINGIIDIFSYDGTNIIRLFKDQSNCLAETRCSIKLYEDGTIYYRGSGGASSSYIDFYSINKNTSTLNTINSYYLKYEEKSSSELPTLTIYDGKTYDYTNDTGTKLNYSSSEELLNVNIKNTKEVDLNNLTWNKFN